MQNLLVINVLTGRRRLGELGAAGLRGAGLFLLARRRRLHRHGILQARLTETKEFSRWMVEELDERLPGFDQQLKIHVTGCPNSCGQHWIADIGIEGKKTKVDGPMVDAYYFFLGGAVGQHQAIGRKVGYRARRRKCPRRSSACSAPTWPNGTTATASAISRPPHDEELRQFLAGQPARRSSGTSRRGARPHGLDG